MVNEKTLDPEDWEKTLRNRSQNAHGYDGASEITHATDLSLKHLKMHLTPLKEKAPRIPQGLEKHTRTLTRDMNGKLLDLNKPP